jgi:hypothetical protein
LMLKIELIFTMLLKKKLILMIEYNVASTRNTDKINGNKKTDTS